MTAEELAKGMKQEAERFIDVHVASSGVPLPFVGQDRDLCVTLMAAFAAVVLASELQRNSRKSGDLSCGPAA